jgi:hypothetical protein
VEVEESQLKYWASPFALASVWRRGEWKKHGTLVQLTELTGAWRGQECGCTTCSWMVYRYPARTFTSTQLTLVVYFLHVWYILNMETELVMGCLNPRWFSSINTYDSHTSYNSFHEPTNASSFSPPLLPYYQDYFIPNVGVHLRPREQVSRIIVLNDPAPKKGE